jgi:hypothetical protein
LLAANTAPHSAKNILTNGNIKVKLIL